VRNETLNKKQHTCYLLMPNANVRFQMSVTVDTEYIDVSPVVSEGISSGELTPEAVQCVQGWAESEAIRVGIN
jgi:hypothetical protein